jgi:hypothetical protein
MRIALLALAPFAISSFSVAHAQSHVIHRRFDFQTPGGHHASVDIDIAASDYAAATARADHQTEQQAVDAAVQWARSTSLATSLRRIAGSHRESPLSVLVAFVQSFPYTPGTGRALHPLETLVEGRPDCDDRALLAVGLAEALGISAGLWVWVGMPHAGLGVVVDRADDGARHVSSVEKDGLHYFYVELTAVGSPIGQTPSEYTDRVRLFTPSGSATPASNSPPSPPADAGVSAAPRPRHGADARATDAGSARDDSEPCDDCSDDVDDGQLIAATMFGAYGGRRGRAILSALYALSIDVDFASPPAEIAPRMGTTDVGVMIDGPGWVLVMVNPTPDDVRREVIANT